MQQVHVGISDIQKEQERTVVSSKLRTSLLTNEGTDHISEMRLQSRRAIIDWICSLNMWRKQADMLEQKQEGTCKWFFETMEFHNWVTSEAKTLRCHGDRECIAA